MGAFPVEPSTWNEFRRFIIPEIVKEGAVEVRKRQQQKSSLLKNPPSRLHRPPPQTPPLPIDTQLAMSTNVIPP